MFKINFKKRQAFILNVLRWVKYIFVSGSLRDTLRNIEVKHYYIINYLQDYPSHFNVLSSMYYRKFRELRKKNLPSLLFQIKCSKIFFFAYFIFLTCSQDNEDHLGT